MKKHILMTAVLASLALAACDDPAPTPPVDDGEVVTDDECPRADGEPCK